MCTEAYHALRAGVDRPPLQPYGATNPAEFFAVATEAFFDVPVTLEHHEPALYGVMRNFYEQDPAARAPRRLTAPSGVRRVGGATVRIDLAGRHQWRWISRRISR